MSPRDREHGAWVLLLLLLHNSQVLWDSEPEKEAMQRRAPSPSFVLSGLWVKKLWPQRVLLLMPLWHFIAKCVLQSLGTSLPPFLCVWRGELFCFPAPATLVRLMCVCALFGGKKRRTRVDMQEKVHCSSLCSPQSRTWAEMCWVTAPDAWPLDLPCLPLHLTKSSPFAMFSFFVCFFSIIFIFSLPTGV